MFFNRKELTITYDFERQKIIREALEKENIEYFVNPVLLTWSINRNQPEYKIYVKKSDYELATHIISKL